MGSNSEKINRLKKYLENKKEVINESEDLSKDIDERKQNDNTISREDSITTLVGEEQDYDHRSITGSNSTLASEEQDDVTLVGEESDIEPTEIKRELSSESIYFDALQGEDIDEEFKTSVQEELKNSPLDKILEEDKKVDDVVLTDELWTLINAIGKRYMDGVEYEKTYKKMNTAERFIMNKILPEILERRYNEEINKISNDIKKTPKEKLEDTLKLISPLFGLKSKFIKEIEQEVNEIKISNKHNKKEMGKLLEKNGLKKESRMKEMNSLIDEIKRKTVDGGYYYVSFKDLDNEDIAYNSYGDGNVVMFDLSDPIKFKGGKYYYYDKELNESRMCKGEELSLKLKEILEKEIKHNRPANLPLGYYSSSVDANNILEKVSRPLKDDGNYYILIEGMNEDNIEKQPIFKDNDIKIYDLSNPLDLKNKKFYYGDDELDKNRLIKIKQDRKFENMKDLLEQAQNYIKYYEYNLTYTKMAVEILEYIHIRPDNMEYNEEKEMIGNLNNGIKEVESEIDKVKKACKELNNKIIEYSELKEKSSDEIKKFKSNEEEKKVDQLSKSIVDKANKLFSYQAKVEKEKLQIKVDGAIKTTGEGAKDIRGTIENFAFWGLGIDKSKGAKNGLVQFLADKIMVDSLAFKDLVLEEAKKRDENKRIEISNGGKTNVKNKKYDKQKNNEKHKTHNRDKISMKEV